MLHQMEGAGLGGWGRTPGVSRRQGKFWLSLDEEGLTAGCAWDQT